MWTHFSRKIIASAFYFRTLKYGFALTIVFTFFWNFLSLSHTKQIVCKRFNRFYFYFHPTRVCNSFSDFYPIPNVYVWSLWWSSLTLVSFFYVHFELISCFVFTDVACLQLLVVDMEKVLEEARTALSHYTHRKAMRRKIPTKWNSKSGKIHYIVYTIVY